MATCGSCGSDNAEGARFCSECGAALGQPGPAAREMRKTVTVVFCDVTGSTSLGEKLDPESLRRVMTRYFEQMQNVLGSHGGSVEKFIGDAVMAVFGIPVLHEDDALRAVRAAADMRTALAELNRDLERQWGVRIETRIGVNTGQVVAGDPAGGQNLVTGDTVNTAARLEQAAEPGEILIGEGTYRLTRDAIVAEPVDPLDLKGKAEAVDAFRLLDVRPGAAGHERRLDSPMVGRERPLRLLRDAFESAVSDRACALFTILGPAGLGKSRLALEFLRGIESEATVLSGRCLSYGEGITFWPVAEMLTRAAGITEADPPERARDRILDLLGAAPDAETVSAQLSTIVGLAGDAPLEGGWAVRRLLETLASERPVVAVFDDIHWAEPTLLDVIDHVADWSRDAPILILCMARPELLEVRPGWGGGKSRAASIPLEPLAEAESDDLIHNLLGNPALTSEIRQRIRASAQGNPLFVEEMLGMLLDDGVLVEKDDEWVTTTDLTTVDVPPAISAILAARLDRLSREERTLLECAAISGEVFERSSLLAIAPEDLYPSIDDLLGALLRKDLIRSSPSDVGGGQAMRFRHILIRDSAYEAVPKQERAALHERFGEWLSSTVGERASEYEEFVGYHLEQAYRYRVQLAPEDGHARDLARRAFVPLAAAGRRARSRDDVGAAANLLGRAIDLLPADDPERLRLVADLGDALFEAGAFARADALLEDAVRTATAMGDRTAAGHARLVQLSALILSEPDRGMGLAAEEATALIPLFEAAGDELGLARAWRTLSYTAWMHMDLAEHERFATEAIVHARRAGDAREEVDLLTNLIGGLVWGPTPTGEVLRRVESIQREHPQSRKLESSALRARSQAHALRGDFEDARTLARRSATILADLGLTVNAAAMSMLTGRVERLAGEDDVAERELRDGLDRLRAMGDRGFASTISAMLGSLLADQGRDDEAEELCRSSRELAASDDTDAQSMWRTAMASVLVHRGELDRAERLVREALAILATTALPLNRGEAWSSLASVYQARGDFTGARDALENALACYEPKEDFIDAARIRERLAGLAG